jgi:hypothetical protein
MLFAFTASAEMKHHHKSKHHYKVYQAAKPFPEIQSKLEKDKMDG